MKLFSIVMDLIAKRKEFVYYNDYIAVENTQMKDTKDMEQFELRLSLKVCPCCCEYFAGAGFSGLPLYNINQRVCRRCYTNTVAPARMDFEQRRVK